MNKSSYLLIISCHSRTINSGSPPRPRFAITELDARGFARLRRDILDGDAYEMGWRKQEMTVTEQPGTTLRANALYESLGFTEAYKAFVWRKTWAP